MKKAICILWILCIGISYCSSQNRIVKTVVDSSSKLPIQFVNIVLTSNPHQGTITNEDGLFILYLINKSDSIEVSHIGYNKIRLSSNFTKDTIYLNSSATLLDEVTISDMSANQVIIQTIKNLEINHSVEPVTYNSFVRIVEYPQDTSVIHIFEEHLFDIHQTKDSNSKFKIIKSRVNAFSGIGEKRLKDLRLINMVSVYSDNTFRYQDDFLKERKTKNYLYTFWDNDLTADTSFYMIECRPKSDTSVLTAKLFIDKKSFAIVKVTKYYKNESDLYDFTDINFKQYNDKWYLSNSWRHFKSSIYARYGDSENNYTDRICIYNVTNEMADLKTFKSTINIFAEPVKRYKGDFKDEFWEKVNYLPIPNWITKRLR
jgi:hypothetical protein